MDVFLYCDFHGHNRKNNVFMYGCNNRGDASLKLHERVFPLMMSKNASNKVKTLLLKNSFKTFIYNTVLLLFTSWRLSSHQSAVTNLLHSPPLDFMWNPSYCVFLHLHLCTLHFPTPTSESLCISSPLRVVSFGCRGAKRERDESPCGDLASRTATQWRPPLEAPLWVSSDFPMCVCCVCVCTSLVLRSRV